jgi:hypothetical protein
VLLARLLILIPALSSMEQAALTGILYESPFKSAVMRVESGLTTRVMEMLEFGECLNRVDDAGAKGDPAPGTTTFSVFYAAIELSPEEEGDRGDVSITDTRGTVESARGMGLPPLKRVVSLTNVEMAVMHTRVTVTPYSQAFIDEQS